MNIGDTAHTASVQPACDVSNCEHLLTPGKPFYATLSPVQDEVAPFWWTVILSNWQQAQIVPG